MEKKIKIPRILVIEDDKEIRELVSQVLEFEGYHVFQADDGRIGLKTIRETPIDLVVLDLQLPTCDGFSFLKQMKSQPRFADIPVMVLTASAEDSKRGKAYQLGAYNYLVKPINLTNLINNVADAICSKTY